MAVDDSDRLAPSTIAAERLLPANTAAPAINGTGDQNLRAAQPDDQASHGHQPGKRQLESDQEKQKDNAQLGNAGDVIGLGDGDPGKPGTDADERAQSERADNRAGTEVSEKPDSNPSAEPAARRRRQCQAPPARRYN